MKYIDAEKLKRLVGELKGRAKRNHYDSWGIVPDALEEVEGFIASLQQEQPEVDLKNEIITQWSKCNPTDEGMGSEYAIIAVEQFAAIARHFWNKGYNARKEENK